MSYFRDQNKLRIDTDFVRAKVIAQSRRPI